MVMKLPSFLDFEASSLSSNSYPIEVGWSLADGSIESHLISPAGLDKWDDWSRLSESVHGISRSELLAHGKSPDWVCRRMNQQLSGQIVYTDSPAYDGMWLAELFSVVNGSRIKFKLGFVDEILFSQINPKPAGRSAALERIRDLKTEARQLVGGQHRAGVDVQYMIELYRLASKVE